MSSVIAFDFGASSGRAIKASFDGEKITYSEIHRFENIPIIKDDHVFHDVDMIVREINLALDKAGEYDSLAFDTWGVDYGLLDDSGKLISMPYHYRDVRTDGALEKAKKIMPQSQLYGETGNQVMQINTLFQLINDENVKKASTLLFMPDLFGYLLTGEKTCEYTIASTSQMLSPKSKDWSKSVLESFGINGSMLLKPQKAPTVLGKYRNGSVITVAGHDTQCAVAAMPCKSSENTAFLSCGTWSLIGCELDEPILTEKSNSLELSNEIGANGKVNYLKNISGLWLIQELKRDLAKRGEEYSYNQLEMLARESKPFKCFVDPDAPQLSKHGNLIDKIRDYCSGTAQPVPETVGELVRCVYESLALKYKYAIEQISACTGKSFERLHLLGGGTKDGFLCQMTADSLDIPVIAGPVEATALGNIILQLIALGQIDSVEQGRKIISKAEKIYTYNSNHTSDWENAYKIYVNIIEKN